MSYYIGLDAHTATCMFVTLDSEGKAVSNLNCATTEGNLLRYVRSHQGRKKLVFEESHLAQWLYLLLKDEVNELVVCNPLYLGKKQGSKTDSRDAWHLANELRCGHVIPVFHADHPLMELRCWVEAYNDLVQDMTRAKNRYKALFRSRGLATAGSTIYKQPERMKELSFESERFVAENLFEQIAHMGETKAAYSKKFKSIAKQHKSIRNLCSIPGFDVIRSAAVAALVCSPERFKNKHKFWAYAMLVKQDRI
ncbi:MAG: transposase, partial [Deltaproteobacteria bacterium]|nr:transposase [Deltaproteobacteria bacterium]